MKALRNIDARHIALVQLDSNTPNDGNVSTTAKTSTTPKNIPLRYTVILGAICIALMVAVIILLMDSRNIRKELSDSMSLSQSLQQQLKTVETDLNVSRVSLNVSKKELLFWNDNAVIVTSTGNSYHRHGCFHLTGARIIIHHVNDAYRLGYDPCLDCKPPEAYEKPMYRVRR